MTLGIPGVAGVFPRAGRRHYIGGMPGWRSVLLLVAATAVLLLLLRLDGAAPQGAESASGAPAEIAGTEPAAPQPSRTLATRGQPTSRPTDPDFEPSFDTSGEPTLVFFRDAIETALRERLPGLKLSPADVDRLARAARRLRASQEALRQLPVGPETADRRRALTEAVAQAGAVFHEVTGLSSSEFTAAVAPEDGLDEFDPDEPIPAGEYLEPRP